MDDADLLLRNVTYRAFVELGRAPTAAEVADRADLAVEDILAGWQRLHAGHALVLDQATLELRMVNPFSAVPSNYRVEAAGRTWYANCAWDAFGILGALHVDGRIETSCPDCGEPMRIAVAGGRPAQTDLWFHCLVPAARWWTDIVFT